MPDITKPTSNNNSNRHNEEQKLIDDDKKSGPKAPVEKKPETFPITKQRLQVTDLIREDIKSGERKGNVYNQSNSKFEDFYMPINDAIQFDKAVFAKAYTELKNAGKCLKDIEIRLQKNENDAAAKFDKYLRGAKSVDTDIKYPLETEKNNLISEREKLYQQRAYLKSIGQDTTNIDKLINEATKSINEVQKTLNWVDELYRIDNEIDQSFAQSLMDIKALQIQIKKDDDWRNETDVNIISDILRLIGGNDNKTPPIVKPSQTRGGATPLSVVLHPVNKPKPSINGIDLDVLATAIQYLPYRDSKGQWHYYTSSKFIGKFDYVHFSKECAWCARFLSVVIRESGHDELLDSVGRDSMALADDWRKLFVNNESLQFVDTRNGQNQNYIPNAGEIAFFKFKGGSNNPVNHVGVIAGSYVDEKGNVHILVIEGNRASKRITGYGKGNKEYNIVNVFDYNLNDSNNGIVGFGNYDNFNDNSIPLIDDVAQM